MTHSAKNDKTRIDCHLTWQNEDLQERISAFVDAELTADEFEVLRHHIALCQTCAQIEQQFRNVDNQLHKDMSRPLVSRSSTTTVGASKQNPVRDLKLPQVAPSQRWLAIGSLAAAGIVALAAFATGTFSSIRNPDKPEVARFENPFTPVFMNNVVAPLGEMALNNDVCKNQQKQVARSLDLELRLIRLNTKNISNDDDELQKINDEIELLMLQVKQLGYATGTPANELPAL